MVHVYILVMALRERVFGRKLCYKYSVLVAQFDIAELVHLPNCKKKDTCNKCSLCSVIEDTQHLVSTCQIVQSIRNTLSFVIKVKMEWTDAIFGFSFECNKKTPYLMT